MLDTGEKTLRQTILNEFPTPIAKACEVLFDSEKKPRAVDVIKAYNLVWKFLGAVITANYLEAGAPSEKINLLLISSIRSITPRRWIYTIRQIIPEILSSLFIPEFMDFYRAVLAPSEGPIQELQKFEKRTAVKYISPDMFEINEALDQLLKLLGSLEFLKNFKLVVSGDEVYKLQGVEPSKDDDPPPIKTGGIILAEVGGRQSLDLKLFLKWDQESRQIDFTDFKKDQDAYRQIIRIPNVSGGVKQYQQLLAGKITPPDRSENYNIPFEEVGEQLNQILQSQAIRRILVESYPGGGKTMLVHQIDQVLDTSDFFIARYYLEKGHLVTSTTIFSRFFYQKMNECLEKPLPVNFKGGAWQDFKRKVSRNFAAGSRKMLLVVDSIDAGIEPFYGEKISVEEFLSVDFPTNLKIVMTTTTGRYPRRFDARVKLKPLKLSEAEKFFTTEHIESSRVNAFWNFYSGQRKYLAQAIKSETDNPENIPPEILKSFNYLLFDCNYFHPVREKIFKYLSGVDRPQSLQQIAKDIEISAPVILDHLKLMQPVIRVNQEKDRMIYSIFAPALADFIQNYDKIKFREII